MYLNIQWKIHLLRLIMFMYGYILLCTHIVNYSWYQTLIRSPISPPFCYVFPWRLQCRNQFGVTYECTFFQDNRSWLMFAFSPISFLLSNVCLWRMYVALTKWFYIPYFERENPTYWRILHILTSNVCLESQHDCESNHWCYQHGHIWVPRVLVRSERRYMTIYTPVLYCLITCKCIFS